MNPKIYISSFANKWIASYHNENTIISASGNTKFEAWDHLNNELLRIYNDFMKIEGWYDRADLPSQKCDENLINGLDCPPGFEVYIETDGVLAQMPVKKK